MQSQVNALLHVWSGLRKDVQTAYPALLGLDLDQERLALQCRTRDLTVFTLDLPNLDSLLLQGLETGRLQLSGPLSRRVSKRVKVPRFLSGLWLRVFDTNGCLKQDVDVNALFFLRQMTRLGKNIKVECSSGRIAAALENYHGIERGLRAPTLKWDSDILECEYRRGFALDLSECGPSHLQGDSLFPETPQGAKGFETIQEEGTTRLLDQVQQVADLIIGSFDVFDPVFFSEMQEMNGKGVGFKHGPGAVAEKLKNHEKFRFLNWPAKLQSFFPFEQCGRTAGSLEERPINHELASRLMHVPKTAKGPRLIAAEPTAHMWCQQASWAFLEEQLVHGDFSGFVDFRKQSSSADLVLQSSLDRKLATVDLSDASDRLSCWTVERIFRSNSSVLKALHAARTRLLRDDVSQEKSFLKLKKFAAQGTATTFPVQSIVFLCAAIGACLDGDITRQKILALRGQVRVYGDDIILPTHGYVRLRCILDALQLKVNVAKSYYHGHFRESCGMDGYRGYDVTPSSPETFVVDGPASSQAVVDTTNNLFSKGLWNASDSCRSLLPLRLQRRLRIVGRMDAGFDGLTSFSGSDESHLDKRWNPRLHRNEVRVWQFYMPNSKRDRQGFSAFLDFVSRKHNHEHARIVSEYAETRKARDRLSWEPLNTDSRNTTGNAFGGTREISISRGSRGDVGVLVFNTRPQRPSR